MKTIGLIGGMSWESTQTYYRLINQKIRAQLGGLHSAKVILNSLDFAEIEPLQRNGDWQATAEILCSAAQSLQSAGADFVLICTNTMHKVAPQIEQSVQIPLLHIADATAKALQQDNITRVGLLGTKFTMEQDFYRNRLQQHGIEVVIPGAKQREQIHSVIFEELCQGITNSASKAAYQEIIGDLGQQGAQAVILGCTEIGLLLQQSDADLALYDTTEIHSEQAVQMALTT
ncbi:MAG: aspartate/glutamate racemase family protein [Pseudomonadota bacterium]